MTENPKLENMGSDNLSSNCQAGELEEKGGQKISASDDHVNRVQHSSTNSDTFVVDMERFSHLIEKDINANSRIPLQRNLSRKGSIRGGEKKINPSTPNQRNASMLSTSPTASGSDDRGHRSLRQPQVHHQITIKNCSLSSAAAESKRGGKRFGFRHSPPTWSTDPRRILLFFATLSSMGTILLIYFTLSMGKLNGDDNGLNW
ncbi:hypothetical protein Pfo_023259 [Paulownia fortunei]|nr:hypothetical protein Pfo_023259 [Paulownia fortunei]